MAIFASTTTSGYSDPLKALSIKALEQRQKDLLAQQAAQQPDAAMMATIPGGIGHVLGVVGDKMAQSRTDQAVAAQRDALARNMAGIDWEKGPTSQQIAGLNADPELMKSVLTTMAENRRAAAQNETQRYGYDKSLEGTQGTNATSLQTNRATVDAALSGQAEESARETARLEAAKAAAAEKVRTDEIVKGQEDTALRAREAQKVLDAEVAAAAQEKRIQERPTDLDVVKADRALARGEIDQPTRDAIVKKATAGSPAEQKFVVEQQLESVNNQSTLKTLDEADALLNSPKGIHAGKGGGAWTTAGQWLPDKLTGIDPETQQNTQRFNKIMGGQALQQLTQMKGASSDKDVAVNFAIVNDPNETPDNKRRALGVLREKLNYYVKINNAAITGAGGTAPNLGGGADPLEGKTASGPDGPIIRRGGKWVPNG